MLEHDFWFLEKREELTLPVKVAGQFPFNNQSSTALKDMVIRKGGGEG